ncbi:hypothetical protein LIER_43098 [Lithospermum erythrorhizon]|uniref:DUF4283 domain-containing protein n=1 Tax=Lithospermum erythrorhizon TaxID=34254 RepID=A0AAV3PFC1_LITER
MADGEAVPPQEGGAQPPFSSVGEVLSPTPLFSQVLLGSLKPSAQVFDPVSLPFKPLSLHQGKPSVLFKVSEKESLLANMKYVLVGKLSHGRPPLSTIKQFFAGLKLKGQFNVSLFDHKHIFIELALKVDYTRIWMKLVWFIQQFPMRIFRWDEAFSPTKESVFAPVWIRIEGLPLYLFDAPSLWSIANAIGKPLRIDPYNLSRINLNSARICVELNVTAPLVDSIWITFEDDASSTILEGFWVKVFYDFVPHYCTGCFHIGHDVVVCKRLKEGALNAHIDQKEGEAWMADKVFDRLPQPDHSVKFGVQPAVQHGNGLGRMEMVSKVWKAKRKVPDLVQDVCNNFLQPGDISTFYPTKVATDLDKVDQQGGALPREEVSVASPGQEQVTRSDVEQYRVPATNGTPGNAELMEEAPADGVFVQFADCVELNGEVTADLPSAHLVDTAEQLTSQPSEAQLSMGEVGQTTLVGPVLRATAELPNSDTSEDNEATGPVHTPLRLDEDDGQKGLVVKDFLHHVTALQFKIDQADNEIIDRIGKTPSTSEFLKKKVVSKAYLEEAKAWRWAHGTKDELCDKSVSGKQGQHSNVKHTWADLVDEEEIQQAEKKDQPHEQRHWSATVQVAQFGEATGIVQAALKQLNGADGLRGQRLTFDDKG